MIQLSSEGVSIAVNSPCKINLHLAVGKKRNDGFHELESIFIALDFADTLVFSVQQGRGGKVAFTQREEGPLKELSQKGQFFPAIPTEKNLVCQAIELFRSKTGFSADLTVDLVKRIPPGSGLGGGSSNAASTLLTLAKLSGKGSRAELLDMAAQLGSDVPFFVDIALPGLTQGFPVENSPARAASGRGEELRFLSPPPPLGVLLVFPGFMSHTGAAYSLLDSFEEKKQSPGMIENTVFSDGSWLPPETWKCDNDFLRLFLRHGTDREKTAYKTILDDLKRAGAAFSGLSGSGSACFGIFSDRQQAIEVDKLLKENFYIVKNTFFLRSQ